MGVYSCTRLDQERAITYLFDLPREDVFKAWTERDRAVRWWGPKGFTTPSLEIDLRPGGAWRGTMRSRDGTNYHHHGVFHEIVEPERLVFTFIWDHQPDDEELVTVTFGERDGKTEMTVRLKATPAARPEPVQKRSQRLEVGAKHGPAAGVLGQTI
jgi:uncharacterized protein YndB with AHSA1/START domain